jgi:DNA repair protein RadD
VVLSTVRNLLHIASWLLPILFGDKVKEPRDYQARALAGIDASWKDARATCLVAPTGSGKTFMGCRAALPRGRVLWIAHRTELVSQGFKALHTEIGGGARMCVVAPGHDFDPSARVFVASVKTLLNRSQLVAQIRPDVMVLDEAHHYEADDWSRVDEWFPDAKVLGPTATPQRGDGRPLDTFDRLVVAAQYSELIDAGYLCDVVVYQPPEHLGNALANDPVATWQKYSRGMPGFAFMSTVALAIELADKFSAAGITAACVHAKTPKGERREIIERFSAGEIHVITNVDTMTEGVDVPAAGCIMLGRAYGEVGPYMQACGRGLRPHPSKQYCVVIDLTGCTIVHGHPTIDRVYSLDGKGMRRADGGENPVRNCQVCGIVYLCSEECCPNGHRTPPRVKRPPMIHSLELQEVWDGERTKEDAKQREYKRLRAVATAKGEMLVWVAREYRKLFGADPRFHDATPAEKKKEFYAMKKFGDATGKNAWYAPMRFKKMFGHYPKGI